MLRRKQYPVLEFLLLELLVFGTSKNEDYVDTQVESIESSHPRCQLKHFQNQNDRRMCAI